MSAKAGKTRFSPSAWKFSQPMAATAIRRSKSHLNPHLPHRPHAYSPLAGASRGAAPVSIFPTRPCGDTAPRSNGRQSQIGAGQQSDNGAEERPSPRKHPGAPSITAMTLSFLSPAIATPLCKAAIPVRRAAILLRSQRYSRPGSRVISPPPMPSPGGSPGILLMHSTVTITTPGTSRLRHVLTANQTSSSILVSHSNNI